MRRLLDGPPQVLATGGGAFIDPADPRSALRERGISVWLRADLDRCSRASAGATTGRCCQMATSARC